MKSDIPREANPGAARLESETHGWVLGVAASHNGAACLLKDGEIVVAVQEERVTRHKRAFVLGHEESFAIRYCLDRAGIRPSDLAAAVICSPLGPASSRLEQNPFLELERHGVPLISIPHHLGHAVGAFATSGFAEAAVLVVDGMGSAWGDLPAEEREKALLLPRHAETTLVHEHASAYEASGTSVVAIEKHVGPVGAVVKWFEDHPHEGVPPYESLGGIFNSVAVRIFGQFHEAGKVMGLAPFGRPLIPVQDFYEIENGTFRFVPTALERWAGKKDDETLAASAQAAVEDGVLHLVRRLRERSKSKNLVYAGGVALNSITNERIVREGGFEDVYIMPAAEDSGTCLGAAYFGAWSLGAAHRPRRLERDSVGRPYELSEIDRAIDGAPSIVRVPSSDGPDGVASVVTLLASGKILGWFEGGSELGPRALGQRSLLCDPRPPHMKDHLNAKVKHREAFRPFAPMVLREDVREWFDIDEDVRADSPFMLRICDVREDKRSLVPAVVHVDGTGRVQTITRESHPHLHAVIRAFRERTGVPILLNTSFNVAGEPIVETPEDALWCLLYTGVDACVLEGRIVTKRPGYESILDLYARRGKISLGARRADRAEIRVETRYGTRIERVSLETVELLEHVSAPIRGWDLLEKVRAALPSAASDEVRFVRKLGALRRAGLLDFGDAPR